MNSVWEYIFPTSVIGIICAVIAWKKNKNPFSWFALGLIGNFITVIFVSTLENTEKEVHKVKQSEISNTTNPVVIEQGNAVEVSIDITKEELSSTLMAAAVCLFLWAFITILFSILQIFNIDNTTKDFLIIGWNLIISALYVVFGIGLLKMESWGYTWALGTTLLNTLLTFFYFNADYVYSIIITPIQLVIIVLLLISSRKFK